MTSGVCITEFSKILASSNCPPDPEGNVFVVRNEEATALQVINELKSVGTSTECINKAVPFFCLYLFGLCGWSGISIHPTSRQCEEIKDTLCQQQWMHVQRLGIDIPDCAMLPVEISSCPAGLSQILPKNGTAMTNISGKVKRMCTTS